MPLIKYQELRMSDERRRIVDQANIIVDEYKKQGYDLTLRQVYYQFIARDLFPATWADPVTKSTNNERSYKKLGQIINDGRLCGLIDWEAIEDRTREMDGNTHWSSPDSIIRAVANQYMINKWADQPYRPEIWVEKDALEGVVGRVARKLDVPFFSCRGYTSQTAMWQNGTRLKAVAMDGQIPVIFHLGDHDPSGIDMSRDIEERMRLFMGDEGDRLQFTRIALTILQVRQLNPPVNPAKVTDSRANSYIRNYGKDCWELDALDPTYIDNLISTHVNKIRDNKKFKVKTAQEQREKDLLLKTSQNWGEVVEFLDEV